METFLSPAAEAGSDVINAGRWIFHAQPGSRHFTGEFRLPPATQLHTTGNTELVVFRQVGTGSEGSRTGEI